MRSYTKRTRAVAGLSALALAGSGLFVSSALAGGKDAKSEHWGVINRNTIGSPVAELRDGPAVLAAGVVSAPPFGKGSLEIAVADNSTTGSPPSEKAAFGNEVDFAGDPVSDINQVGFYVYRTDGDVAKGADNLPNITFEIDPDVNTNAPSPVAINYTSMVWDPHDDGSIPVNAWSQYIDATSNGTWYFTGSAGAVTNCNLGHPCSFDVAMGSLGPNAAIGSIAVAKGRDYQFQGAVDGLRINDRTYDFEADGVHAKGAK